MPHGGFRAAIRRVKGGGLSGTQTWDFNPHDRFGASRNYTYRITKTGPSGGSYTFTTSAIGGVNAASLAAGDPNYEFVNVIGVYAVGGDNNRGSNQAGATVTVPQTLSGNALLGFKIFDSSFLEIPGTPFTL